MFIQKTNLDDLTQRFGEAFKISSTQSDYLRDLIDINEEVALTTDTQLTMLVEEVDFFIKEYSRSANMFRFTNDLLNKDRARVLSDHLFLLHQFFVYLLDEVQAKASVFCDENTLTQIYESVKLMENTLEKYAKFVFQ